MPQLMALSCPVCAAPLTADSDRCRFCGSVIFIKPDLPKLSLAQLNHSVIQDHILDFRKRVRASQYDEEAHYGLGVAYFNLGLLEESVDELTQAAKLMPENPDIQVQLAVVLRGSSRAGNVAAREQMNTRLKRALLLKPDHFEANMLKAEELIDARNYTEAIKLLQPMMFIDANRTKAKLIPAIESLGTLSLVQENWKVAEWCWKLLEPIDPNAAQDMAVRFLNQNSSYLPKTVKLGEEVKPPSQRSRRITRTTVSALGGLMGGFIVWLIIVIIIDSISAEIVGWFYAPFLLGFLAFLVSPFIAGIWYWKKSTPAIIVPASVSPKSQGKISREDLLAGRGSSFTIYQTADELIAKLSWISSGK